MIRKHPRLSYEATEAEENMRREIFIRVVCSAPWPAEFFRHYKLASEAADFYADAEARLHAERRP